MTAILGISAYYHDSAAVLVIDGQIVAAAQEERFTRKKGDFQFPQNAVDCCLKEGGLTPDRLDFVGFYEKPFLKFDRLLETYLAYAPLGLRSFVTAMPSWLKRKLRLPREINRGLGGAYKRRLIFAEHHESHAASCFFPSPFEQAAILTADGVGEWATASWGVGRGNKIEISRELRFPHSLGLLYSAFTTFCGFKVNSGEHKLMGLAPYGEPIYTEAILNKFMDLKEDGSFRLDMSYFNYCQGLTMTSGKFHRFFGGPPRKPDAPIGKREMDLAASIQKAIEEILARIARHIHAKSGQRHLCMAGGVALNCVANSRVLREGPFEDIWIQPAAGDAGGALGAALLIWHQLLDKPRDAMISDNQRGSLLGPSFTDEHIRRFLQARGAVYQVYEEETLLERVVDLLVSGKVVGWFQGRMEFGPRALGCRSILGDARRPEMQSLINMKVKFRESFRPFAPSVLQERAHDFFDRPPQKLSPYMLFVAHVNPVHRKESEPTEKVEGLDKLKLVRSDIPAVTHVDYSARLQTVDRARHGRYYELIKRFEKRTGCPLIVNTSFNIRGEPIVCTPDDAYRCFMATDMDALVLENHVLYKSDQPQAKQHEVDAYLSSFELD